MRIDMVNSQAFARDALDGLFSQDGGRLPARRVIHEAAADVEEGLKFWKAFAGTMPSRRRVSRERRKRRG